MDQVDLRWYYECGGKVEEDGDVLFEDTFPEDVLSAQECLVLTVDHTYLNEVVKLKCSEL